MSGALLVTNRRLFISRWLGLSAGGVWLAVTLLVIGILYAHAFQPNKDSVLPSGEAAVEGSGHYVVKLFAHPFCPCTRTSLEQFGDSLTRFPSDVQAEIIFVIAGFEEQKIADSPLVKRAQVLPDVQVRFDATGDAAERCGASVSGEVLAWDASGRLVFRGGITAARGHQGAATGQTELENIVSGRSPGPCATPVFGCHLPTR